MSASDEWTEWHLTPRGWEMGSTRVDFSPTRLVAPPPDRVLTFRYRETLSAGISRTSIAKTELWRSEDAVRIRELMTKFGSCPDER
jgi:hypothetical protein